MATVPTLSRIRAVGAELGSVLPIVLQLDDADSPADVLDALVLSAFADGTQPHARSADLDRVRPEASLLPAGALAVRTATGPSSRAVLAAGDGWTLRAVRYRGRSAHLVVTAVTDELARMVLGEAIKDAVEPVPERAATVGMGFWHLSGRRGPIRVGRQITAPRWTEVRANYPTAVVSDLDRLMAMGPVDINGRLLLLHGPPGTGKTTLLRTVARQWHDWCLSDCVLDPDRLFEDPAYLMDVAVGEEDGGDDKDAEPEAEFDPAGIDPAGIAPAGVTHRVRRRWRLLILEDCDELIRAGAKQASGQGLSRLLNLTDGLLGQGRDVLIAITTNEELSKLHPAVVRPGRCLARLELGPLPPEQAAAWLGRSTGIGPGGATLAQLYALRDGAPAVDEPTHPVGLYL